MENKYLPISKNFATLSIHSYKKTEDENYSCMVPPAVSSVNFKVQFSPSEDFISQKYTYSRRFNPTRYNLEQCLATLEGGKYGLCFASGCGGLSSLLGALKPGSHIVCSNSIYGGTIILLAEIAKAFSFTTSFVDINNLKDLENAIQPNSELIWVEPISNPLMKVADIKKISKIARERNVLLAVDNTILSSYFHRPLELGADIVCNSLTKYVNGHGDVIMGAIVVNDKDLYDKLKFIQFGMGVIPSPIDCAQVLRSLKTFPLRMKQHNINALTVAKFTFLPLVSFYVNGDLQHTKKLLNNFDLITPTSSFGSVESVVQIPLLLSQSAVPEALSNPDVTGNLVRLSVGIEDDFDIIHDLKQALDRI